MAIARVAASLVTIAGLVLVTTSAGWPAAVGTVLHASVAALWLGCVVGLLLDLVPGRTTTPGRAAGEAVALLERTSVLIAGSLAVLWGTGAVLAGQQLGGVDGLVSSPYGRAIAAKLALTLLATGLAAWNRYHLAPVILADQRDTDATAPDDAAAGASWTTVRRAATVEAGLLLAALLATAALVDLEPPSAATGARVHREVVQVTELLQLEVDVVPAEVGRNTLHLFYVDARSGAPADPADEVVIELSLPSSGGEAAVEVPPKAGAGHYILVTDALDDDGIWEVSIDTVLGPDEVVTSRFSLPVGPA